jgi:hypothetical protein
MRPLQPGSQQGPDSGENGLEDPPASGYKYAEAGWEVQMRQNAPLLEDGFRLIGGVLVNSTPAFLSQSSRLHVLHQQRSRSVFFA